jgi:predicted metal-binding protein
MKAFEVYCKKAMQMGMDGAKVIEPRSITTAEWVRMKCQFGCPMFGKRLTCPPHTPTPDVTRKIIDSYRKAILVHRKLKSEDRTESSDEYLFRLEFNKAVVGLEIGIFLDGYYKAWSMGSGYCRLCEECDPEGSCRHGFEARPAMEACGIDVFKTARDNGFHIDVARTHEDDMNVFGVVLIE